MQIRRIFIMATDIGSKKLNPYPIHLFSDWVGFRSDWVNN
jgi:hypothetical protein